MLDIREARVLFVGDGPDDIRRLNGFLAKVRVPRFVFASVPTFDAAREAMAGDSVDVVLFDLSADEAGGLGDLRKICVDFPSLPVVVLTGAEEESMGRQALRLGAQDHLDKSRATGRAVARCLVDAIERHRAHRARQDEGPSPALLASVTGVLDRLPIGVILVDAEGRVLFMNHMARAIIKTSDGLVVDGNGICRASVASESKALARLIRETLEVGNDGDQDAEYALMLSRPSGKPPLAAMVAAIGTARSRPGAAIFLSDPEHPLEISVDTLSGLYGLTQAESRLALGLTSGKKLDDLAREWDVSMHTVRSQLKQVFRKTGACRQSELVKLILTGPAAIPSVAPNSEKRQLS